MVTQKESIHLQHSYICILTKIRKYKNFIAAILLAVYAFVAAPVQFWHLHNYPVTSKSQLSSVEKETTSFATPTGKSVEGNCQICSYKYSTYSDDATVIFVALLFNATAKEGFYYNPIFLSPLFNFANKGPPALA